MKSPFPGMDPYLESHWRDVHAAFVIFARAQLNERLPGDLRCRVEERVFVEHEPVAETYLEIIDAASGNKVITVIEFLSLANKTLGEGQDVYLKKQREILQARVNLVEIDLLRSGDRISLPESRVPADHRTPYRVCVRRGQHPGKVELYRVSLTETLPAIRVPLRDTDPDVALAIQPLVDQCYREGRYDDIDYARDPEPPLDARDAAWADALLRAAGKRRSAN